MKKNIWIFNHYATKMYKSSGGRHYWFAENLIKQGYKPTIFCASTVHNSDENINTGKQKYIIKIINEIPFVFIKTPVYKGNGIQRIRNIISFYRNLFSVAKEYARLNSKPDIILASSVHPLTLVAGIKIAKKFGVRCIVEIRDLWPESLVAYGLIKKSNPFLKFLYIFEKWIYKEADKLIFTMEGGIDYIKEKGWNREIDISKVHHINNGVDLEVFNYNKENYWIKDTDLDDPNIFKVVYTGSIGKTANLQVLVDAARIIRDDGYNKLKIIIYGDGNYREYLKKYAEDNNIKNVIFKGRIDKKYIPYILSKCDLNILNLYKHELFRFGVSQNKLFDYFASGKPILSIEYNHDLVKKYRCGITLRDSNSEEIAENIIKFYNMDIEEVRLLSKNAQQAAKNYDFKILTDKLIRLF
jgi:glycosyltransferase involved in cell wall biosynthesis